MTRLVTWWKSDIPYHTFMYTNFIVGFAFTPFAIYSNYQLQVTGFAIGTDIDGQVCSTYCVVPWGSGRIDLNAAILYMNALTFALGGVVTILIIAYADFWRYKTWLISIMIAVYGAVTVPSYWLRISTLRAFNSLFALSVLFGIISSVLIALLNIYIPHCMRTATPGNIDEEISPDSKTNVSLNNHSSKAVTEKAKAERAYGFTMSIFAMLTNNIAGILILVVTIILSTTLPLTSQQSAGLLVSTIVGCITLAGALPSWLGLPQLPTKPYPATHKWYTALLQILTPFRALLANPNMLLLLLAYTVYTDTTFATASIIGQLYYSELTPNTLEYSLYSLATYIFFVICTTAFYAAHRRWKFTLEKCFVAGYAIILLVPIWGIIGIARQDAFGYKHRWEFYTQLLISQTSSALVNPTFRLLYAEHIPAGEEVMWYGMQVVLSCATTWVTYVATGPLQNATHNLRFPLILCAVFFTLALGVEGVRLWVKTRRGSGSTTRGVVENVVDDVVEGGGVEGKGVLVGQACG